MNHGAVRSGHGHGMGVSLRRGDERGDAIQEVCNGSIWLLAESPWAGNIRRVDDAGRGHT